MPVAVSRVLTGIVLFLPDNKHWGEGGALSPFTSEEGQTQEKRLTPSPSHTDGKGQGVDLKPGSADCPPRPLRPSMELEGLLESMSPSGSQPWLHMESSGEFSMRFPESHPRPASQHRWGWGQAC